MIVGDNIKRKREEKGLSQNRLAKLAEISQSAISDIESGCVTRMPSTGTLSRLAKALDCTVAELMGENVETRMPTNEELKFALFGGDKEITDEQFEEVKRYAQYIKERGSNDK